MFLDFRLKVRDFFRKNKKKIYIAIVIIVVIIILNIEVGRRLDSQAPKINYEPHTPIVSGKETPKEVQDDVEDKIEEYCKYCNNKEYENAYAMLTDECKEYVFEDDIENFKKYIDYIFNGNKVYSIQDYSNKDNVYVYNLTISADLMATGMNTEDSKSMYIDKVVFIKDDNNTKFSVKGFIKSEDMDCLGEDDYMKISIYKKITYYDKVTYKMQITNKTTYPIVIANEKEKSEVLLSLGGDNRGMVLDNYRNDFIIARVGLKNLSEMTFNKYYDESKKETAIIFNKIRVLKKYTEIDSNWESELADAVKLYSLQIPLNN